MQSSNIQAFNFKLTGRKVMILLIFFILPIIAKATDRYHSHISNNENWYLQSWVWVLGGAVLLLLMLALLSNNNHSTNP